MANRIKAQKCLRLTRKIEKSLDPFGIKKIGWGRVTWESLERQVIQNYCEEKLFFAR
jgi:hypothetical protein